MNNNLDNFDRELKTIKKNQTNNRNEKCNN